MNNRSVAPHLSRTVFLFLFLFMFMSLVFRDALPFLRWFPGVC